LQRIIDVGSGAGASIANAQTVLPDASFVGLDVSSLALEHSRSRTGAGVAKASLSSSLPVHPGSVDGLLCDDVIEHLVDPDLLAREAWRVLRPGGHLFLTTPNLAAWFNRGMLLLGRQPLFSEVSLERVFGRPGTDIVGHLRLFTARALRQFLEHHGFEVVALDGAAFEAVPAWLRPIDRGMTRAVTTAAILVCWARKPPCPPVS
jgi:2-polyprenyl-3-methyl-5-hydroxy-6-metoxy-1,4-benzoquinol methylase